MQSTISLSAVNHNQFQNHEKLPVTAMEKSSGTSNARYLKSLMVKFLHKLDATCQLLPQVPTLVLSRVSYNLVIKMAKKLHKEATQVEKLWNATVCRLIPVEELAKNMQEYFGILQRFIMVTYGAIGGEAGVTLASRTRLSVNHIVDASINLIKEAVFSYGEWEGDIYDKIPKMSEAVREAIGILLKTPDNVTVIREALIQATVPMNETLHFMKEVMMEQGPGSSTEQQKEVSIYKMLDIGGSGGLTSEEMTMAKIAIDWLSGLFKMMNLLGPLVGNLRISESERTMENLVDSLENILKLSVAIESHTRVFIMCVLPDQDITSIAYLIHALQNIERDVCEIQVELQHIEKSVQIEPESMHFSVKYHKEYADSAKQVKELDQELASRKKELDQVLASRKKELDQELASRKEELDKELASKKKEV